MSYRILFILNAVVVALIGVFFLILPQTALDLFGTETYVPMLLVARFFGGAMLMSGVFIWFLKDLIDEATQKNVAIALMAASVGAFVLVLIGMTSSGIIRTNGWIPLVVSVLFAVGYAFALFIQPRMIPAGGPPAFRKQV
jgi:hypothetical protein